MHNLFNNNSTGFLLRFALILTLSFGIFFMIDHFELVVKGSFVPASVGE